MDIRLQRPKIKVWPLLLALRCRFRGLKNLEQSLTDRPLPARSCNLEARQVCHIEDVDRLFPESGDMGRADVQIEARQGRGQVKEKAWPIKP